MKRLTLIVTFLLLLSYSKAQNLDSLERVLKTNIPDTAKAKIYLTLTEKYHLIDGKKAIDFADKGIALCEKTSYDQIKYEIFLEKGKILVMISKYDESLSLYNQCLTYFTKQKDNRNIASVYGAFGVTYWLSAFYEKAYTMQSKSLKIYEDLRTSPFKGFIYYLYFVI